MNCDVMIFKETWLHSGIPLDNAIKLVRHHALQETKGEGLHIYINKPLY